MQELVVVQAESESNLEQRIIEQYLANKGYSPADWRNLPPEQAKRLMIEACQYAALKLAEIESTTRMWAEVEGKE